MPRGRERCHRVAGTDATDQSGLAAAPLQRRGCNATLAPHQWHEPLPESVAVWPATGTNCQLYDPSYNVSCSTPYTPLIRTSLLAVIRVLGLSSPSPPVPTMISRMPFTASATPAGVWGPNRS